jgi:hypothetical protein
VLVVAQRRHVASAAHSAPLGAERTGKRERGVVWTENRSHGWTREQKGAIRVVWLLVAFLTLFVFVTGCSYCHCYRRPCGVFWVFFMAPCPLFFDA